MSRCKVEEGGASSILVKQMENLSLSGSANTQFAAVGVLLRWVVSKQKGQPKEKKNQLCIKFLKMLNEKRLKSERRLRKRSMLKSAC